MLVDPDHLAGLTLFQRGTRCQRPVNSLMNVIDGQAGVMQPFAVLANVPGKPMIDIERLAELDLHVSEHEVRLTRAALDEIPRLNSLGNAKEAAIALKRHINVIHCDREMLDAEYLHPSLHLLDRDWRLPVPAVSAHPFGKRTGVESPAGGASTVLKGEVGEAVGQAVCVTTPTPASQDLSSFFIRQGGVPSTTRQLLTIIW